MSSEAVSLSILFRDMALVLADFSKQHPSTRLRFLLEERKIHLHHSLISPLCCAVLFMYE